MVEAVHMERKDRESEVHFTPQFSVRLTEYRFHKNLILTVFYHLLSPGGNRPLKVNYIPCYLIFFSSPARISKNRPHWISNNSLYNFVALQKRYQRIQSNRFFEKRFFSYFLMIFYYSISCLN